jgi:hypothetical protein
MSGKERPPSCFTIADAARADEAGLPKCSAHGLRKAGATITAENGATDRQLMAFEAAPECRRTKVRERLLPIRRPTNWEIGVYG